ncbi:MAG: hypothetical protein RLZZ427_471 [Pseudomonadota bacterium]|jgi:AcrR family transcriptional regulator
MRIITRSYRRNNQDRTIHPTRVKLVETVEALLDVHSPEQITADMVLAASGVSKGSLYHHFEDFADLMATVLVQQFSRNVDRDVATAQMLLNQATTIEEFYAGVDLITDVAQSPMAQPQRLRRARLIVLASQDPRLAAKLAAEQDRLSAGLAELFVLAQQRGWFRSDFSPNVAAVVVQAYTLGKLLDDFAGTPVPSQHWNQTVKQFIRSAFGNPELNPPPVPQPE